jgi:hypothetical protein
MGRLRHRSEVLGWLLPRIAEDPMATDSPTKRPKASIAPPSATPAAAHVSQWQNPASGGFLARLKSLATAPFRYVARSLILRLQRKHRFDIMFGMLHGQFVTITVYAVARLGIADLLRDGPKTAAELAQLTNSDKLSLERVMRALATVGVFRRTPDYKYHLTPLSQTLLSDSPEAMRDWAVCFGEVLLPALTAFGECVQSGEKPFVQVMGMSGWEYLSEHPSLGYAFDRAMHSVTARQMPYIVEACDVRNSRILADIGGGRGALITALLEANPGVKGILYDRPEVTEQGQQRIDAAGLGDRCKAVSGSFLESVPAEADTYVIKHVLHDWNDDDVRTIFRNCRRAMSGDDRLLILEMLTEHPDFGRDFAFKWYDFTQMCGTGGRERTVPEFDSLLAEAGLQLCSVTPSKLPDVTVLEARAI